MHFQVAVGEYLPYLNLTVLLGQVHMTGPLAEAFHLLSVRLNFTYTLHKVKGNSWGILGQNGWTGMLGMIERNEVDMAIGPFTLTYDRWKYFKLSNPVYVDNVQILVPATEWQMTLFSVFTVFSPSVWMNLLASVLLVTLITTFVDKYRERDVHFNLRFCHNVWLTTSTLLQKGRRKKPDWYLQTFLSVMWMLFCLMISLSFGAILLTRLFVRKVQKIDSIDDLAAATNIQPILEHHSSLFSTFKNSQSNVFQMIFQRVISNPHVGVQTYENMSTVGMEQVLSGSAAMITDSMGLKGFIMKRHQLGLPCNFCLAKELVYTMWKVIAFSQKFPDDWLVKINKHLRHTLDSGWLQARMQKEYALYEECVSPGGSEHSSLGLEHTKGIFLIWFLGCVASVLVLFVERFIAHGRDPSCHTSKVKEGVNNTMPLRIYQYLAVESKKLPF